MTRRTLSLLLKISISLIGLIYVIGQISLETTWQAMQSAEIGWLLFAFFLMLLSLFLRAFRWQVLLLGLAEKVSYWRLAELYFVGNFFNAFLPSGVGGDVVRAVEATKDVSADDAAGTVIIDRLTGLLITFVFAFFALPFRPNSFPENWFWILCFTSIAGLIGGYLLLSGRLYQLGKSLFRNNQLRFGRMIDKHLLPILNTAKACGNRALLQAFAISFLFGLLLNGWWFAVAKAYGFEQVTYGYLFLVTPIMSLALLVPSIGGLGVREALLPMLMVGAGVDTGEAIIYSFTVFILLRLTSLIGLPIYLRSK